VATLAVPDRGSGDCELQRLHRTTDFGPKFCRGWGGSLRAVPASVRNPYQGAQRGAGAIRSGGQWPIGRLRSARSELVPGGIAKEINASSAERLLAGVNPTSAVERARHALALAHLDDLRRLDTQMRASKKRIADAVAASGTSLTKIFGVGPVVAAMVIGYTGDVGHFQSRDHFAAYTGTAPIEVSSGGRITHRLSRRGNRQRNHAIHIAAITQIRFTHSPGRPFFDRKVAEAKTKKEAVRALKRRISDAVYRLLLTDDAEEQGPGGQAGTTLQSSVAGLAPQRPALRRSHSRTPTNARTRRTAAAKTNSSPARTPTRKRT
jgi:transposase